MGMVDKQKKVCQLLASTEDRTQDLVLTKHALYQRSSGSCTFLGRKPVVPNAYLGTYYP